MLQICISVLEGVVQRIAGKHLPAPNVRFDRHKYAHLYDVTLRCQDDSLLQVRYFYNEHFTVFGTHILVCLRILRTNFTA